MTLQEYSWLRSDLGELNRLIATTPESAFIDRMSLERRRDKVAKELAAFPVPARWPVYGRLAFAGGPVTDRRGIDAAFLGKATEAFANAVASAAASRLGPIGENGSAPSRDDCRLLISNRNVGFGGLRFEEATPHHELKPGPIPVSLGIEHIVGILNASVKDDDALTHAIADAHPSVIAALRRFLETLVSAGAVFSLSFEGDEFRFDDVEQARTSLSRLTRLSIPKDKSKPAAER